MTAPSTKAKSVFSAVVFLLFAIPQSAEARGPLTFEERVAAQEAIERVFYEHRIWPKENPGPKPPFEELVPRAVIERKVRDYLAASSALDEFWRRPIAPGQLQAEIDRLLTRTKDPAMLQELLGALGNEPYIVAECLARPILADRKVRDYYAWDAELHADTRADAEALAGSLTAETFEQPGPGTTRQVELHVGDAIDAGALGQEELSQEEFDARLRTLPTEPGVVQLRQTPDAFLLYLTRERSQSHYLGSVRVFMKRSFDEWFESVRPILPEPAPADDIYSTQGVTPLIGLLKPDSWALEDFAPASRSHHLAVWTGTEMIVWGGWSSGATTNTGGRYDPATDTWTATSTGANSPAAAQDVLGVWTGTRLVVWRGKVDGEPPYIYNPTDDSWVVGSSSGAPQRRDAATAIWTGSDVLIWGGYRGASYLNDGGHYNPSSNLWTPIAASGVPAGRRDHTAVWTGSQMIVWGGWGGAGYLNDGAIYTPAVGWSLTQSSGAPSARRDHVAVWTGATMIVWGGRRASTTPLNDGGVYDPSGSGSWSPTASLGAPSARSEHGAAWTGSRMVVWGGIGSASCCPFGDGARYDPGGTGAWEPMDSAAPDARYYHSTVWDGTEVLVWGGERPNGASAFSFRNGGRYDPISDSWALLGSPSGRTKFPSVWTGTEMFVWGGVGEGADLFASGATYSPALNTWFATSMVGAPAARQIHTAIWTGAEAIIWGGAASGKLNTGGRYDPATGIWAPTLVDGTTPSARSSHTAIWTGTEMIIWGGDNDNTGGRYNPQFDNWTATGPSGLQGRNGHTAVWTGDRMVIWGGTDVFGNKLDTGARYDPVTDLWTATALGPSGRTGHSASWTGGAMIIWGGDPLPTGGWYDPISDSWIPTQVSGAPSARSGHSAVWTGQSMIVWGGGTGDASGGSLAMNNTWNALPLLNAPLPRSSHRAEWTGSEMLVWGGSSGGSYLANLGIYFPNTSPVASADLVTSLGGDATFTLGLGETITLDGTASTTGSNPYSIPPNEDKLDALTYEWDLNGDAGFDVACTGAAGSGVDAVGASPVLTEQDIAALGVAVPGNYPVWLRVTDSGAQTPLKSCTSEVLTVRNALPPSGTVLVPNGGESWTYSATPGARSQHLIAWQSSDPYGLARTRVSYTTGSIWTCIADSGYRYASGTVGIPIPDGSGTASASIIVPTDDDAPIEDVNVRVNISHTAVGDLTLTLRAPGGTSVVLAAQRGGSGDNFAGTVFDDEASTPIGSGSAPFAGFYQPEQPLSALDALTTAGTWTLDVVDGSAGNAGSIDSWSITFGLDAACQDRNPAGSSVLLADSQSFLWDMPTQAEAAGQGQTFPSSTAKVRLDLWSTSNNTATDESDATFYIVQPTTSSVKTLILWHSMRVENQHGTTEKDSLDAKLSELAAHARIAGAVRDLNSAGAAVTSAYSAWDADPGNQTLANAVAVEIQAYIDQQVTGTFTNAGYLILVGDDYQIPFYRMVDGAAFYPESNYPGELTPPLNTTTTIGAAVAAGRLLTDNFYSELDPEPTPLAAPHDLRYQNDLATGRLVETPQQIRDVIDTYIAFDGEVDVLDPGRVLVTGHDFLFDSATQIRTDLQAKFPTRVDCLLDDPDAEVGGPCVDQQFNDVDLRDQLFPTPAAPHRVVNVNTHANHFEWATSSTSLDTTTMDGVGQLLSGTVVYSSGCHSALPVPSADPHPLDFPELMAKKRVVSYIGNTGYGWGLRFGVGLTEELMALLTDQLLNNPSITTGKALAKAKREYALEQRRYDVFDEKVMHQLTLFGIPNYLVTTSVATARGPEPVLPSASDAAMEGCAEGICVSKRFGQQGESNASPVGMTVLNLSFDFSGAYQGPITTADGDYYTVNGAASGEVGDALQPNFAYDSTLSDTTSHGVVFTGGEFQEQATFDPVIAVPRSTNLDRGEGSIPKTVIMMPAMSFTNGVLLQGDPGQTNMVVHTGAFDDVTKIERTFDTMQFTVYYHKTSSDTTPPSFGGAGPFDTLPAGSLEASFAVPVSDASGVLRVLVTYKESLAGGPPDGRWTSLELANDGTGTWRGTLPVKQSTMYFVQAVDNAGNVGVVSDSGADEEGVTGTPYGSNWSGPKTFDITVADTDSDGLPDVYEAQHPCLDNPPGTNDGPLDPDYDHLTNLEEFALDTLPCNGDTDAGGDNDGSELNNGRDPFNQGDDLYLTITVVKNGSQYDIDWSGVANDDIDGDYFVYRSATPFFDPTDLISPIPLSGCPTNCDTSFTDSTATCDPCFYNVWNVKLETPPPSVDAVVPSTGTQGDPVSVYGYDFAPGAVVLFGAVPATNVVYVNPSRITCQVPAGSGTVDVTVRNPNGQEGTLTGGFTYQ